MFLDEFRTMVRDGFCAAFSSFQAPFRASFIELTR